MREVTSISLQFDAGSRVRLSCGTAPGCSVSGSTVVLDLRSAFTDWFASNTALGSLALLRLPLAIGGSVLGTVTIRIRNSMGTSNQLSFVLP
jgi:hypothetical protein